MKREVEPMDFDLLKECCAELGVKLVPAASSDFLTLTDEHGNEFIITAEDNIFASLLDYCEDFEDDDADGGNAE